MRSAIVEDGIVVNVIVGEVEGSIPCESNVGIGWSFDGSAFEPPPEELHIPTRDDVNGERDRRISGGLIFEGVAYQTDAQAFTNVAGSATDALAAKLDGAQPGDFFWHGEEDQFAWIALDNTTHPMDADTVIAFARAFKEHKRNIIFKGLALKAMDPIPLDYTNDTYWL